MVIWIGLLLPWRRRSSLAAVVVVPDFDFAHAGVHVVVDFD